MEKDVQYFIPKKAFEDFIKSLFESEKASNPNLLTIKQAANFLHCSTVTIWKLRKEGKLQHVSVGRKVFIKKSELEKFLNREVHNG